MKRDKLSHTGKKRILLDLFRKISSPLKGRNLLKNNFIKKIYNLLYKYLKPCGLVLVKLDNYSMCVNANDATISQSLLMKGVYEPIETKLFKKELRTGSIVLDLGANIGYYSMLAASIIGDKGKVYAFEPEPHNYSLLVKSIKVNNFCNIIPLQKAVADKNKKVILYLDKSIGGHRISNFKESISNIEINAISLDKFFKKTPKVDIIKMDIEGSELLALKGMKKLINKNRKITILAEFNPELMSTLNTNPRDFLFWFKKRNFDIRHIDYKTKRIIPVGNNLVQFSKRKEPASLLCKRLK